MTGRRKSVLLGGRRRRRAGPRAAVAALAVVAIAALVLLGLPSLPSLSSSSGGGDAPSGRVPRAVAPAPEASGLLDRARGAAAAVAAGGGDPRRYAIDLGAPDTVRLRFHRKPRAGLLFDVESGRVLWRRRATRSLPIASLTKMMTALLVVEREGAHERVRITRRATRTPGSAVGLLPKGRKVQLEALMNGLMLVSGNDAAVALAQHTSGSVPAFVSLMNERAVEMGLSCTRFSTPHGLEDQGNHSCATDLAALARADLAQRRIRRIARRRQAVLAFPIKGGRLFLYNHNPLVRSGYPGVTGLKTGYTDRAGRSIVATARRNGLELGVVLLHSYDPASQARKLLDRGFRETRP